MPKLMTFHKILEGAKAGDRESWLAFLSGYTPVIMALAAVYLPGVDSQSVWRDLLRALSAQKCARLRSLDQQAEREFLVGLRYDLLDTADRLDSSLDLSGPLRITGATVSALLKGLPLAHQEIVLLKLAGYSDATLEKILTISRAVADKGLEPLRADYGEALEKREDRSPWPAAWRKLVRELRGTQTESCPPLRQFVRIVDGQVNWSEKEPAEKHLTGCLPCLERWIAMREIIHWRRETRPLSSAQAEALLPALPVQAASQPRKPFLRRMLG